MLYNTIRRTRRREVLALAETVYTKSELIAVLKDFGREFRIPTIYLFGSYARGEATPESDVDIVIDSRNIHGLLEFERARQYLSDRLGKPVDMISLRAIEDEKDFPYRKAFMSSFLKDRVKIDV